MNEQPKMTEQEQKDWTAKVNTLSRDVQAQLGIIMFIEQVMNSKVNRMIKIDALRKTIEFYEGFVKRDTLHKVVESGSNGLEFIPEAARGSMAQFLLVIAEISEEINIKQLKDRMIIMQSILGDGK